MRASWSRFVVVLSIFCIVTLLALFLNGSVVNTHAVLYRSQPSQPPILSPGPPTDTPLPADTLVPTLPAPAPTTVPPADPWVPTLPAPASVTEAPEEERRF